jgi:MmyB-like transcription regulator ligand binding domain
MALREAPQSADSASLLMGALAKSPGRGRRRLRWIPWTPRAHNVRFHINGVNHLHHPVVGELSLNFERLELVADPGLTIFTAEPGSCDAEALHVRGSWAATLDQSEAALATGPE